ncbi:hypothetical protein QR680_015891 [Steinernema hermaphroditum]|uniref:Galectin domain-containing protein n=1 Tax=Steinernema hermaphroditum TaxID=289476 RepID=A0AA39LL05_9BILA|nr:hypothetical protein QR680_015891 [Steinernema hermaphroditum]
MIRRTRLGALLLLFFITYWAFYIHRLDNVCSNIPVDESVILIDRIVLSCLNCSVDDTLTIQFAFFSTKPPHIKNSRFHKAYNASNKDFVVIDFNGEKRAVRKFSTNIGYVRGVKVQIPSDPERFLWEWNRAKLLECKNIQMKRENTDRVIGLDFVNYMAELRDIMIWHNVTPILLGGSLLGWYRECSIIPHTTDVDFGVLREEHSQSLIYSTFLMPKVFLAYWMLGEFDDCFEISLYRKGIKIDVFYVYDEPLENRSTYCVVEVQKKEKTILGYPRIMKDNICAADLLGKLMYVPCNAEQIIEIMDHHHHHHHQQHQEDPFGQPFIKDGQNPAPYPSNGFGPFPGHQQPHIGGGIGFQPDVTGSPAYQSPTNNADGEGRQPFPTMHTHTLPVNVDLKQQIRPGETVKFNGRVHENAKRFDVNFAYNYDSYNTQNNLIILHISVRFDEKKIVFNTHSNGEWAKEERVSNPFKRGEHFDLRVRAHSDVYEITANHKDIHEFKARLPLQEIRKIHVDGDISLDQLEWGGAYHAVPYQQGFPFGSLRAGSRVYVSGSASGDFQVNLLNSRGERLFHFNPRFSEKKVVRNSEVDGQWGSEEREGKFPFHKNEGFDITIINEPYALRQRATSEGGTDIHIM